MDKTPSRFSRVIRGDVVPFFRNEIKRCFGGDGTGSPGGSVPELPRHLIIDAWHLGASDIHCEPQSDGMRIRLRVDGAVYDVALLSREQGRVLLNQFKTMAGIDPVVHFTPSDASASFELVDGKLDLRLSLAPSSSGETLAVRLLDPKRLERSILELGLSEENLKLLTGWLSNIDGMFIVAGPTGSGKTTTAYALLHEMKLGNRVILSLEDPVEYQVDGIVQIEINQLQEMTFSEGVKAMLRHDPDVLMLGEIRDAVSAQTAVRAAVAGRALLSTIHSRDAIGAVTTLRNWGLSDREIGEALKVVVAQRLVRRLCESCRKPCRLTKADEAWLRSFGLKSPVRMWEAVGCEKCNQLGYRGRTGIFEVWRLKEDDYQAIVSGADELALRRKLQARKHKFQMDDAVAKLKHGATSLEEVKRMAGGIQPWPN